MMACHLFFNSDKEFLKAVVSGLFCLRSTPVSCLISPASTSQVYTATQMTQLYLAFSPAVLGEDEAALKAMHDCIHDLRNWMIEDRLMLNDDKTELMLIGTRQQLQKFNLKDITVGDTIVEVKSVARNLGSWFDRNLDMSFHSCLLYTSPSPRDLSTSRMPSSA